MYCNLVPYVPNTNSITQSLALNLNETQGWVGGWMGGRAGGRHRPQRPTCVAFPGSPSPAWLHTAEGSGLVSMAAWWLATWPPPHLSSHTWRRGEAGGDRWTGETA